MNDDRDGGVREARVLDVLRDRPEWPAAVARLRRLYAQGGAAAQEEAAGYGQKYAGQRGAMVVDVVASRRRTYSSRVRRIVNGWWEEAREPTLAWLAANPPDGARLGLMASEPETMRKVAENLVAFASSRGLDEDRGCRTWGRGGRWPGTCASARPRRGRRVRHWPRFVRFDAHALRWQGA
jgi:hypothetical protein